MEYLRLRMINKMARTTLHCTGVTCFLFTLTLINFTCIFLQSVCMLVKKYICYNNPCKCYNFISPRLVALIMKIVVAFWWCFRMLTKVCDDVIFYSFLGGCISYRYLLAYMVRNWRKWNKMIGVLCHDSTLWGYTGPGTTLANEMNCVFLSHLWDRLR